MRTTLSAAGAKAFNFSTRILVASGGGLQAHGVSSVGRSVHFNEQIPTHQIGFSSGSTTLHSLSGLRKEIASLAANPAFQRKYKIESGPGPKLGRSAFQFEPNRRSHAGVHEPPLDTARPELPLPDSL